MPQKRENSFSSLFTIIYYGFIYALLSGFPLYLCCGIWNGLVFPLYSFTTIWVLAFLVFFVLSIVVLLVGAWLLGRFIARRTASLSRGGVAGLCMGLILFLLIWIVNTVSIQWRISVQRYPGNPVNGQLLLLLISCFTPFLVVFGCWLCALFGAYRFLDVDKK